jgi:hypothetical protein
MNCRDEGTKPLVYAFVRLEVGMGISWTEVYGDGCRRGGGDMDWIGLHNVESL